MKRKHTPLLALALMVPACLHGSAATIENSDSISNSVNFRIESRASFAGGENTPFWLVSNIHGLGSPVFNNGYVKGEIYKPIDNNKRFSWGAGADITGAWNLPAAFAIRQLYAEIHYRAILIAVGAKNYGSYYNNHTLSSGDLLFSDNAMAIPQVRIGTNDFASFWGTKGWFSVRGYLAYGMFTDSKWLKNWVAPGTSRTSNVLFCSRGLWLRGGNLKKFPVTLDVGIEMGTQFGGTAYINDKVIKMPHNFKAWLKALIPMSGDKSTPEGEQVNIQGNMTGEYSISVSIDPGKGWFIRPYWEHYFEDQSQLTFEYGPWKDGLYGIEINFPKNPFISKLVYEYIGTKDQTGAVLNNYTPEIPEQVSGRDNYFNHYLYGCWQNWGMTIGTPLAISPLYNKNHQFYISNTRFIANHIGLEGQPTGDLTWRLLLTFSRNWGSYWRPLTDIMDNFSGLIEANYHPGKFKGWFAKAALAWDKGGMLGDNFGGMISVGYEGNFSIVKNGKH